MTNPSQETNSGSDIEMCHESAAAMEEGGATTGAYGLSLSSSLHGDPDPIRPARAIISQITDPSVRGQADGLLSILKKVLDSVRQRRGDLGDIPALHASAGDGDSVLFEWVFPDFRVGFNIEPDADDSGWHLVSSKRLDELAMSGHLRDMQEAIALLFDFILANV